MKVRTRRWRCRNNSSLQRQGQTNDHGAKLPELQENASGVEVNSPDHEENAAVSTHEANHANDEPNHEYHVNDEIGHLVQAVPASDDEDSGTENDRNDAAFATDDEESSEGEKESYQVEVARTMSDIVHTRDMLFSLTRRVDQLLEFCKILQTKQNQQQEPDEHHQQQLELQPPNEGAGKSSQ